MYMLHLGKSTPPVQWAKKILDNPRTRSLPSRSVLYKVESLEEIIEVALASAMVSDSVPVSLILVGPSGTAKSALIKQYRTESSGIYECDSITSQGLWDMLQGDSKNAIKFLAIPDFNPTLSRKPEIVTSTVSNLLTMTYDGSVRINDGRREKICQHAPVGLISSVTPEIYRLNARRWLWLGIRRRIIPLFFSYSPETIGTLQQLIRNNKIHSFLDGKKSFKIPARTYKVPIVHPEDVLIQSESVNLAMKLGKEAAWDKSKKERRWFNVDIVPLSPHLTLRTLAQSYARLNNRGQVGSSDLSFLQRFIAFCDPELPRII